MSTPSRLEGGLRPPFEHPPETGCAGEARARTRNTKWSALWLGSTCFLRHSSGRLCTIAILSAVVLIAALPALAQSPTYGVGRAPTPEELRAWDIAIGPDGRELPPGSGTAKTGKAVYDAKCAVCHGPTGTEGPQDVLVGGKGTLNTPKPLKTVGSYWPYATTLWDFTNRAMPFNAPGSLTADEVYGATAYVLYLNGIIGDNDVIDANTLPQVKMPNRDAFVPDPRPDIGKRAKSASK